MNMQTEPIRLPAWAASFLSVVILPFVISLLTEIDWRTALATALATIIPLLAAAEGARAFVDSPETKELKRAAEPAADVHVDLVEK